MPQSAIDARLERLKISLPTPPQPVANYVSFVTAGDLIHISGQVSTGPDGGIKGTIGEDLDLVQDQAAARLCAINLLAQMRLAADGDLDRIVRVVKLGGFVQVAQDFVEIPAVMNGCSDLIAEVLGEAGKHARSAVGVYRLPLNFAVEVDAVVEIARG